MAAHNPPDHIVFHGGDMTTLDYELELGETAAFDLFHHDSTLFCAHGLTAPDGLCYQGCDPTMTGWVTGSASS